MEFTYKPKGVCSRMMQITTDGDTIRSVKVIGGCDGNLQGISRLVEGMKIDDTIARLEGVRCGYKSTSCPDQLAQALKELKAQAAAE